MTDIDKFQWRQMFNNSKGKTSVILFSGFIVLLSGVGGFVSSGVTVLIMVIWKMEKDINIINFLNMLVMQSIWMVTTGGVMLGVHRLSKDKEVVKVDEATKPTGDSTKTGDAPIVNY